MPQRDAVSLRCPRTPPGPPSQKSNLPRTPNPSETKSKPKCRASPKEKKHVPLKSPTKLSRQSSNLKTTKKSPLTTKLNLSLRTSPKVENKEGDEEVSSKSVSSKVQDQVSSSSGNTASSTSESLENVSKWEAFEVRYIKPLANRKASFTADSSTECAVWRKANKRIPYRKQTVCVEKIHITNLLNTTREVCGNLSSNRMSEFTDPALGDRPIAEKEVQPDAEREGNNSTSKTRGQHENRHNKSKTEEFCKVTGTPSDFVQTKVEKLKTIGGQLTFPEHTQRHGDLSTISKEDLSLQNGKFEDDSGDEGDDNEENEDEDDESWEGEEEETEHEDERSSSGTSEEDDDKDDEEDTDITTEEGSGDGFSRDVSSNVKDSVKETSLSCLCHAQRHSDSVLKAIVTTSDNEHSQTVTLPVSDGMMKKQLSSAHMERNPNHSEDRADDGTPSKARIKLGGRQDILVMIPRERTEIKPERVRVQQETLRKENMVTVSVSRTKSSESTQNSFSGTDTLLPRQVRESKDGGVSSTTYCSSVLPECNDLESTLQQSCNTSGTQRAISYPTLSAQEIESYKETALEILLRRKKALEQQTSEVRPSSPSATKKRHPVKQAASASKCACPKQVHTSPSPSSVCSYRRFKDQMDRHKQRMTKAQQRPGFVSISRASLAGSTSRKGSKGWRHPVTLSHDQKSSKEEAQKVAYSNTGEKRLPVMETKNTSLVTLKSRNEKVSTPEQTTPRIKSQVPKNPAAVLLRKTPSTPDKTTVGVRPKVSYSTPSSPKSRSLKSPFVALSHSEPPQGTGKYRASSDVKGSSPTAVKTPKGEMNVETLSRVKLSKTSLVTSRALSSLPALTVPETPPLGACLTGRSTKGVGRLEATTTDSEPRDDKYFHRASVEKGRTPEAHKHSPPHIRVPYLLPTYENKQMKMSAFPDERETERSDKGHIPDSGTDQRIDQRPEKSAGSPVSDCSPLGVGRGRERGASPDSDPDTNLKNCKEHPPASGSDSSSDRTIGYLELYRSILKSPTAKAAQALGHFFQSRNRRKPDALKVIEQGNDISVDEIIRSYQKIFSELNFHSSNVEVSKERPGKQTTETSQDRCPTQKETLSRATQSTQAPSLSFVMPDSPVTSGLCGPVPVKRSSGMSQTSCGSLPNEQGKHPAESALSAKALLPEVASGDHGPELGTASWWNSPEKSRKSVCEQKTEKIHSALLSESAKDECGVHYCWDEDTQAHGVDLDKTVGKTTIPSPRRTGRRRGGGAKTAQKHSLAVGLGVLRKVNQYIRSTEDEDKFAKSMTSTPGIRNANSTSFITRWQSQPNLNHISKVSLLNSFRNQNDRDFGDPSMKTLKVEKISKAMGSVSGLSETSSISRSFGVRVCSAPSANISLNRQGRNKLLRGLRRREAKALGTGSVLNNSTIGSGIDARSLSTSTIAQHAQCTTPQHQVTGIPVGTSALQRNAPHYKDRTFSNHENVNLITPNRTFTKEGSDDPTLDTPHIQKNNTQTASHESTDIDRLSRDYFHPANVDSAQSIPWIETTQGVSYSSHALKLQNRPRKSSLSSKKEKPNVIPNRPKSEYQVFAKRPLIRDGKRLGTSPLARRPSAFPNFGQRSWSAKDLRASSASPRPRLALKQASSVPSVKPVKKTEIIPPLRTRGLSNLNTISLNDRKILPQSERIQITTRRSKSALDRHHNPEKDVSGSDGLKDRKQTFSDTRLDEIREHSPIFGAPFHSPNKRVASPQLQLPQGPGEEKTEQLDKEVSKETTDVGPNRLTSERCEPPVEPKQLNSPMTLHSEDEHPARVKTMQKPISSMDKWESFADPQTSRVGFFTNEVPPGVTEIKIVMSMGGKGLCLQDVSSTKGSKTLEERASSCEERNVTQGPLGVDEKGEATSCVATKGDKSPRDESEYSEGDSLLALRKKTVAKTCEKIIRESSMSPTSNCLESVDVKVTATDEALAIPLEGKENRLNQDNPVVADSSTSLEVTKSTGTEAVYSSNEAKRTSAGTDNDLKTTMCSEVGFGHSEVRVTTPDGAATDYSSETVSIISEVHVEKAPRNTSLLPSGAHKHRETKFKTDENHGKTLLKGNKSTVQNISKLDTKKIPPASEKKTKSFVRESYDNIRHNSEEVITCNTVMTERSKHSSQDTTKTDALSFSSKDHWVDTSSSFKSSDEEHGDGKGYPNDYELPPGNRYPRQTLPNQLTCAKNVRGEILPEHGGQSNEEDSEKKNMGRKNSFASPTSTQDEYESSPDQERTTKQRSTRHNSWSGTTTSRLSKRGQGVSRLKTRSSFILTENTGAEPTKRTIVEQGYARSCGENGRKDKAQYDSSSTISPSKRPQVVVSTSKYHHAGDVLPKYPVSRSGKHPENVLGSLVVVETHSKGLDEKCSSSTDDVSPSFILSDGTIEIEKSLLDPFGVLYAETSADSKLARPCRVSNQTQSVSNMTCSLSKNLEQDQRPEPPPNVDSGITEAFPQRLGEYDNDPFRTSGNQNTEDAVNECGQSVGVLRGGIQEANRHSMTEIHRPLSQLSTKDEGLRSVLAALAILRRLPLLDESGGGFSDLIVENCTENLSYSTENPVLNDHGLYGGKAAGSPRQPKASVETRRPITLNKESSVVRMEPTAQTRDRSNQEDFLISSSRMAPSSTLAENANEERGYPSTNYTVSKEALKPFHRCPGIVGDPTDAGIKTLPVGKCDYANNVECEIKTPTGKTFPVETEGAHSMTTRKKLVQPSSAPAQSVDASRKDRESLIQQKSVENLEQFLRSYSSRQKQCIVWRKGSPPQKPSSSDRDDSVLSLLGHRPPVMTSGWMSSWEKTTDYGHNSTGLIREGPPLANMDFWNNNTAFAADEKIKLLNNRHLMSSFCPSADIPFDDSHKKGTSQSETRVSHSCLNEPTFQRCKSFSELFENSSVEMQKGKDKTLKLCHCCMCAREKLATTGTKESSAYASPLPAQTPVFLTPGTKRPPTLELEQNTSNVSEATFCKFNYPGFSNCSNAGSTSAFVNMNCKPLSAVPTGIQPSSKETMDTSFTLSPEILTKEFGFLKNCKRKSEKRQGIQGRFRLRRGSLTPPPVTKISDDLILFSDSTQSSSTSLINRKEGFGFCIPQSHKDGHMYQCINTSDETLIDNEENDLSCKNLHGKFLTDSSVSLDVTFDQPGSFRSRCSSIPFPDRNVDNLLGCFNSDFKTSPPIPSPRTPKSPTGFKRRSRRTTKKRWHHQLTSVSSTELRSSLRDSDWLVHPLNTNNTKEVSLRQGKLCERNSSRDGPLRSWSTCYSFPAVYDDPAEKTLGQSAIHNKCASLQLSPELDINGTCTIGSISPDSTHESDPEQSFVDVGTVGRKSTTTKKESVSSLTSSVVCSKYRITTKLCDEYLPLARSSSDRRVLNMMVDLTKNFIHILNIFKKNSKPRTRRKHTSLKRHLRVKRLSGEIVPRRKLFHHAKQASVETGTPKQQQMILGILEESKGPPGFVCNCVERKETSLSSKSMESLGETSGKKTDWSGVDELDCAELLQEVPPQRRHKQRRDEDCHKSLAKATRKNFHTDFQHLALHFLSALTAPVGPLLAFSPQPLSGISEGVIMVTSTPHQDAPSRVHAGCPGLSSALPSFSGTPRTERAVSKTINNGNLICKTTGSQLLDKGQVLAESVVVDPLERSAFSESSRKGVGAVEPCFEELCLGSGQAENLHSLQTEIVFLITKLPSEVSQPTEQDSFCLETASLRNQETGDQVFGHQQSKPQHKKWNRLSSHSPRRKPHHEPWSRAAHKSCPACAPCAPSFCGRRQSRGTFGVPASSDVDDPSALDYEEWLLGCHNKRTVHVPRSKRHWAQPRLERRCPSHVYSKAGHTRGCCWRRQRPKFFHKPPRCYGQCARFSDGGGPTRLGSGRGRHRDRCGGKHLETSGERCWGRYGEASWENRYKERFVDTHSKMHGGVGMSSLSDQAPDWVGRGELSPECELVDSTPMSDMSTDFDEEDLDIVVNGDKEGIFASEDCNLDTREELVSLSTELLASDLDDTEFESQESLGMFHAMQSSRRSGTRSVDEISSRLWDQYVHKSHKRRVLKQNSSATGDLRGERHFFFDTVFCNKRCQTLETGPSPLPTLPAMRIVYRDEGTSVSADKNNTPSETKHERSARAVEIQTEPEMCAEEMSHEKGKTEVCSNMRNHVRRDEITVILKRCMQTVFEETVVKILSDFEQRRLHERKIEETEEKCCFTSPNGQTTTDLHCGPKTSLLGKHSEVKNSDTQTSSISLPSRFYTSQNSPEILTLPLTSQRDELLLKAYSHGEQTQKKQKGSRRRLSQKTSKSFQSPRSDSSNGSAKGKPVSDSKLCHKTPAMVMGMLTSPIVKAGDGKTKTNGQVRSLSDSCLSKTSKDVLLSHMHQRPLSSTGYCPHWGTKRSPRTPSPGQFYFLSRHISSGLAHKGQYTDSKTFSGCGLRKNSRQHSSAKSVECGSGIFQTARKEKEIKENTDSSFPGRGGYGKRHQGACNSHSDVLSRRCCRAQGDPQPSTSNSHETIPESKADSTTFWKSTSSGSKRKKLPLFSKKRLPGMLNVSLCKDSSSKDGSDISTSSSAKCDYGGLDRVLSKESRSLWKKISRLEKSYEVCHMCKKRYDSLLRSYNLSLSGRLSEEGNKKSSTTPQTSSSPSACCKSLHSKEKASVQNDARGDKVLLEQKPRHVRGDEENMVAQERGSPQKYLEELEARNNAPGVWNDAIGDKKSEKAALSMTSSCEIVKKKDFDKEERAQDGKNNLAKEISGDREGVYCTFDKTYGAEKSQQCSGQIPQDTTGTAAQAEGCGDCHAISNPEVKTEKMSFESSRDKILSGSEIATIICEAVPEGTKGTLGVGCSKSLPFVDFRKKQACVQPDRESQAKHADKVDLLARQTGEHRRAEKKIYEKDLAAVYAESPVLSTQETASSKSTAKTSKEGDKDTQVSEVDGLITKLKTMLKEVVEKFPSRTNRTGEEVSNVSPSLSRTNKTSNPESGVKINIEDRSAVTDTEDKSSAFTQGEETTQNCPLRLYSDLEISQPSTSVPDFSTTHSTPLVVATSCHQVSHGPGDGNSRQRLCKPPKHPASATELAKRRESSSLENVRITGGQEGSCAKTWPGQQDDTERRSGPTYKHFSLRGYKSPTFPNRQRTTGVFGTVSEGVRSVKDFVFKLENVNKVNQSQEQHISPVRKVQFRGQGSLTASSERCPDKESEIDDLQFKDSSSSRFWNVTTPRGIQGDPPATNVLPGRAFLSNDVAELCLRQEQLVDIVKGDLFASIQEDTIVSQASSRNAILKSQDDIPAHWAEHDEGKKIRGDPPYANPTKKRLKTNEVRGSVPFPRKTTGDRALSWSSATWLNTEDHETGRKYHSLTWSEQAPSPSALGEGPAVASEARSTKSSPLPKALCYSDETSFCRTMQELTDHSRDGVSTAPRSYPTSAVASEKPNLSSYPLTLKSRKAVAKANDCHMDDHGLVPKNLSKDSLADEVCSAGSKGAFVVDEYSQRGGDIDRVSSIDDHPNKHTELHEISLTEKSGSGPQNAVDFTAKALTSCKEAPKDMSSELVKREHTNVSTHKCRTVSTSAEDNPSDSQADTPGHSCRLSDVVHGASAPVSWRKKERSLALGIAQEEEGEHNASLRIKDARNRNEIKTREAAREVVSRGGCDSDKSRKVTFKTSMRSRSGSVSEDFEKSFDFRNIRAVDKLSDSLLSQSLEEHFESNKKNSGVTTSSLTNQRNNLQNILVNSSGAVGLDSRSTTAAADKVETSDVPRCRFNSQKHFCLESSYGESTGQQFRSHSLLGMETKETSFRDGTDHFSASKSSECQKAPTVFTSSGEVHASYRDIVDLSRVGVHADASTLQAVSGIEKTIYADDLPDQLDHLGTYTSSGSFREAVVSETCSYPGGTGGDVLAICPHEGKETAEKVRINAVVSLDSLSQDGASSLLSESQEWLDSACLPCIDVLLAVDHSRDDLWTPGVIGGDGKCNQEESLARHLNSVTSRGQVNEMTSSLSNVDCSSNSKVVDNHDVGCGERSLFLPDQRQNIAVSLPAANVCSPSVSPSLGFLSQHMLCLEKPNTQVESMERDPAFLSQSELGNTSRLVPEVQSAKNDVAISKGINKHNLIHVPTGNPQNSGSAKTVVTEICLRDVSPDTKGEDKELMSSDGVQKSSAKIEKKEGEYTVSDCYPETIHPGILEAISNTNSDGADVAMSAISGGNTFELSIPESDDEKTPKCHENAAHNCYVSTNTSTLRYVNTPNCYSNTAPSPVNTPTCYSNTAPNPVNTPTCNSNTAPSSVNTSTCYSNTAPSPMNTPACYFNTASRPVNTPTCYSNTAPSPVNTPTCYSNTAPSPVNTPTCYSNTAPSPVNTPTCYSNTTPSPVNTPACYFNTAPSPVNTSTCYSNTAPSPVNTPTCYSNTAAGAVNTPTCYSNTLSSYANTTTCNANIFTFHANTPVCYVSTQTPTCHTNTGTCHADNPSCCVNTSTCYAGTVTCCTATSARYANNTSGCCAHTSPIYELISTCYANTSTCYENIPLCYANTSTCYANTPTCNANTSRCFARTSLISENISTSYTKTSTSKATCCISTSTCCTNTSTCCKNTLVSDTSTLKSCEYTPVHHATTTSSWAGTPKSCENAKTYYEHTTPHTSTSKSCEHTLLSYEDTLKSYRYNHSYQHTLFCGKPRKPYEYMSKSYGNTPWSCKNIPKPFERSPNYIEKTNRPVYLENTTKPFADSQTRLSNTPSCFARTLPSYASPARSSVSTDTRNVSARQSSENVSALCQRKISQSHQNAPVSSSHAEPAPSTQHQRVNQASGSQPEIPVDIYTRPAWKDKHGGRSRWKGKKESSVPTRTVVISGPLINLAMPVFRHHRETEADDDGSNRGLLNAERVRCAEHDALKSSGVDTARPAEDPCAVRDGVDVCTELNEENKRASWKSAVRKMLPFGRKSSAKKPGADGGHTLSRGAKMS